FVSRFPNLPEDLGRSQPETFATKECRKTVGSPDLAYCRANASGPPDVLLIGDSHAGALYRGLAPEYQKRSEVFMNLGDPGCVPLYDRDRSGEGFGRCHPAVNRALDFAVSSSSVRTIILALRGPANMLGHDSGLFGNGPRKEIRWQGAPASSDQAAT